MGPWIAGIIGGIIFLLVVVLLIRALLFRPLPQRKRSGNESPGEEEPGNISPGEEEPGNTSPAYKAELDDKKIIGHFAEMISCKTVSYKDTSLEDAAEFRKFRDLLTERYPNIASCCERYEIGRTGVLYHWRGKSSNEPSVLMSHYDVVPADAAQWVNDPFAAVIEDSVIWGRGTLDTKATLCGIMEAAEKLISEGFIPENDIYLSFSGEEETDRDSTPAIVSYLKEKGVRPLMVLDEGGAVVQGMVPGVRKRCALVGTGEKGKMHLRLSLRTKGGHASAPPPISPVGRLSRCVTKIEKDPFRFRITKPVKEMFDILGRHSSIGLRIVFANLWFFGPLLDLLTRKTGGELNALFRTTVAFTGMKGSEAINVIPPLAYVDADVRLVEGDTGDSVISGLKKRIGSGRADKEKDSRTGKAEVEVECLNLIPVRPFSDTGNKAWVKLGDCIREIWGDVLVAPYLMVACTDSRHYTDICGNVYKFSAMELSSEERKMIHGHNERIPADKLLTVVRFYLRLMESI